MKIAPKYIFIGIWLALLVLLFIMFGLAHFNLGGLGTAIILLLAVVQMILVLLFFMRLRTSPNIARLVSGVGFLWLFIMFLLVFADYMTRQWH
ncbi:MAG: cytochrome C oxidase subunit IV family protein [Limisphaerales bacterium]